LVGVFHPANDIRLSQSPLPLDAAFADHPFV
jgi:hypothetical protein